MTPGDPMTEEGVDKGIGRAFEDKDDREDALLEDGQGLGLSREGPPA